MRSHIIHVSRKIFSSTSTIGNLYFDNRFMCYTLEDTVRKTKVPGETAIPSGSYEVVLLPSKKYGRMMPYLLDVKDFQGIMIHPGNTPLHTRGCILVGETIMKDFVGHSQNAFDKLYPSIEAAVKDKKLTLEIR